MTTKYFTTPIYYVNAVPHIGSAYCTLATDTLARYWRQKLGKDEVHFLTGTDENSQKTVEAAEKEGKAIGPYLDEMAQTWRETFETIGISFDDFIRTTEDRHHRTVGRILQQIYDNGDIYKGTYTGKYCTGCETFLKESDLNENGECAAHLRKPQEIQEENYFFRLSAYQDRLIEFYEKHPTWVQPNSRRNELLSFMKSGLEDISISREHCEIGIALPWDESHKTYVWTEALINYISAVDGTDKADFWPAFHIVGKDITRFHCIIWPAMLLSSGEPLPEGVFAHGFFTVDGHKMSKSLGNVVDPLDLAQTYGNDALRVGLLSSFEFGGDGDFSRENFGSFYHSKLAGGVGNLFNRVVILVEKFLGGEKPILGDRPARRSSESEDGSQESGVRGDFVERFGGHMERYEIKAAIDTFFALVDRANERLNETEVWKLAKVDLEAAREVFAELLMYLEDLVKMAEVILPDKVEAMRAMLGDEDRVGDGGILYGKVDGGLDSGQGDRSPAYAKASAGKQETGAREVNLSVDHALVDRKFPIVAAVLEIPKVVGRQNAELRAYLKEEVASLDIESALASPHIKASREDYARVGLEEPHPAEWLLQMIQQSGKLPNINNVVDSYNIVSAKYQLSFGVHDLDKIEGDVRFAITDGSERYVPLGSDKTIPVHAGEYAFMDEKEILCRFDIKQSEKTKIDTDTRHVLVYVQGNESTSREIVEKALEEALENFRRFCGGGGVRKIL